MTDSSLLYQCVYNESLQPRNALLQSQSGFSKFFAPSSVHDIALNERVNVANKVLFKFDRIF